MVINEGKNRQIREMFLKVGKDVMKLQRIAIGRLRLGSLDKGTWKLLSSQDLRKVFEPDIFEAKVRPSRAARLSPHAATKIRRRSDKRNPGKVPILFAE